MESVLPGGVQASPQGPSRPPTGSPGTQQGGRSKQAVAWPHTGGPPSESANLSCDQRAPWSPDWPHIARAELARRGGWISHGRAPGLYISLASLVNGGLSQEMTPPHCDQLRFLNPRGSEQRRMGISPEEMPSRGRPAGHSTRQCAAV